MSQLIDQFTAAGHRGLQRGVKNAVTSAVREGVESAIQRLRFQQFLDEGESVLATFEAETQPPLLIRLIPLVPDLLTRSKKFTLVVTPTRMAVIAMTNPLNKFKSPAPKAMHVSLPWADIAAIEPRKHLLVSSVTIRKTDGKAHRFSNLIKGDADRLVAAAQSAVKPSALAS